MFAVPKELIVAIYTVSTLILCPVTKSNLNGAELYIIALFNVLFAV